MRPHFSWSLGLVGLASIVVVMTGDRSPQLVQATTRSPSPPSSAYTGSAHSSEAFLPSSLGRKTVELAQRDIFVASFTSPASVPDARTETMPPTPDSAQVTKQTTRNTPTPQVRYAGSMTTVEGSKIILVSDGTQSVVAEPSAKLGGRYEVEGVTLTAVRLRESQSGTVVDIPIPSQTGAQ